MGAAKKAPVVEQKVKKVVKTGKVAIVKTELEKMSDKLTPNMAVSIPDGDFRYKRAWIIKEVPTGENQADQYMITFGKGMPRATVAITAIHDASLVKPDMAASIPDRDYHYKRAKAVKEIPTGKDKIDQYMITFGKCMPRATIPVAIIHDASLVK